jgi:RHS repeat-associated protein
MTQAGTSFYTRQTYFPYGAPRTTEGSALPTDYTFTGQKNDASTDLMFYGARYYDTSLGRFTQPDTIVPSPLNPQSLNRFSYVYNNPIRFMDPSGHVPTCEDDPACGDGDPNTGAGNQGGNQDPVTLPAEKPYCEKFPEQCMTPPAGDGGNQGGDDGDCNRAKCHQDATPQDKAAECLKSLDCFLHMLVPSHVGLRGQLSVGGGILPFAGVVGLGPNVTFGANFMCMTNLSQCSGGFDLVGALTVQGIGPGGSLTGGILIGAGASSLDPIATGLSGSLGGEGCFLFCIAGSTSVPLKTEPGIGPIPSITGLYVDPKTGFVPATDYFGIGLGGSFPEIVRGVGGGGVGISMSWADIFSFR